MRGRRTCECWDRFLDNEVMDSETAAEVENLTQKFLEQHGFPHRCLNGEK